MMMENRKPPYSCRTLICFKMSEKDYTVNKDDPLSAKNWREVYNLVSIIENMRVYNKELVDKYVKDINEKIYFLANQKRIELEKSFRKPIKLIVSIDKSRINFETLRTFNPGLENQNLVSHDLNTKLDPEIPNTNIELGKPSFYFNHQDQNSIDILVSVTEDIINSFSNSDLNCMMKSRVASERIDWDYRKISPEQPLIENNEMIFNFQEREHRFFSQSESCKKRVQGKCWENREENIEYSVSKSNTFASQNEETETDCSFDMNYSSENCSCEMSVDESSSETIGGPVRRSRRKMSTVHQFSAARLRRSKRIQSSAIAKEKISAKFVPLQELKRKRSSTSKETSSNPLERI